ncbi:MAG: hypothetical protein MHM6MM_001198 [Cercozoa sp. M6MM]
MVDVSFMKWLILILLMAQTSASFLLIRYARQEQGLRFSSSVAVWCMEILKLIFSAIVLHREGKRQLWTLLRRRGSGAMALVASIYFVQNNFPYLALRHLDSGVYTALQQSKILTTALAFCFLMGRQFSARRWRALLLLLVGTVVVVSGNGTGSDDSEDTNGRQPFIGLIAVAAQVTCSGIAACIFELALKGKQAKDTDKQPSLWERNFQLAAFSVGMGTLTLMLKEGSHIYHHGLFFDFNLIVVLAVLAGAAGGLLVGLTVKYADSIVKGFASSGAIVINSLLSSWMFGDDLSLQFAMGACSIVLATFNYADDEGTEPVNLSLLSLLPRRALQGYRRLRTPSTAV